MKKALWIMIAAAAAAGTAHADFAKGSQTVSVFGGAGGSSDRYDFKGPETRPVTGGGGAWGAQYFYYLAAAPAIAIGADVNASYNGNLGTEDLIANTHTEARLKSTTEMIMARLAYPRGRARPYLFAGIGVQESSLLLSAQPLPGSAWPDHGTDRRTLIDEHETSAAIGFGIGLDVFVTESVFVGTELRSTLLVGTSPDLTPSAQALGFSMRDRHAVNQGNVFFRVGWKFGV